jgi:hypothetical protein
MTSYEEIRAAILASTKEVNIEFSDEDDGRLDSKVKEKTYLMKLKDVMKTNYPKVQFIIEKDRTTRDFRVNGLPINLKLTTGKSTDNAWSKQGIIHTFIGKEINYNANMNLVHEYLHKYPWRTSREYMNEYHYLVVFKDSGKVILKSILDVYNIKPNPTNIFQIHWGKELDSQVEFDVYEAQQRVFNVIQTSVIQKMETCSNWAYQDDQLPTSGL